MNKLSFILLFVVCAAWAEDEVEIPLPMSEEEFFERYEELLDEVHKGVLCDPEKEEQEYLVPDLLEEPDKVRM